MYSSTGLESSNFVSSFEKAFFSVIGVSIILLITLTVLMIFFAIRYNRKRNKVSADINGSLKLEITWTLIPIILVLMMFHFGWAGWKPMNKPPKDGINITTIARMWNFSFLYENGKQSTELIVPVGIPVKLKLVSMDVLHSVFIPNFRIKTDIIPGRPRIMWFIPQREGSYDLYCAEYCGLQHAYMGANLKAVSQEDFNKWYIDTTAVKPVVDESVPGAAGFAILKAQGCNACHSSDGSKIIGPSYLGVWGEQVVVIRNGQEVSLTVDSAYIRRSIFDPNSEIVKGYQKDLMQPYNNVISEEDIGKIIEYIKTLEE
jgi:cytochrome c oxidase subunit 2